MKTRKDHAGLSITGRVATFHFRLLSPSKSLGAAAQKEISYDNSHPPAQGHGSVESCDFNGGMKSPGSQLLCHLKTT